MVRVMMAHIKLEVPYRKTRGHSTSLLLRQGKELRHSFSQFDDDFYIMRNYAKEYIGFFTRMAAKVAAFTILQYVNIINHKPIGQVKYALY
jgi:hypothetical protein